MLAVSSHVLPRAFAGVISHQIGADPSISTRISFAFINICKTHMHTKLDHCLESAIAAISAPSL